MDSSINGIPYRTLYAVLSGNVTDPSTRNAKWIYSSFPITGSDTTPAIAYPVIVVEPFVIESCNSDSFGNHLNEFKLGTTIEIHDKTAGSRFDTVCDQVVKAIVNNKNEFAKSGLDFINITGGNYDQIDLSRTNRIHIKSIGLGATAYD